MFEGSVFEPLYALGYPIFYLLNDWIRILNNMLEITAHGVGILLPIQISTRVLLQESSYVWSYEISARWHTDRWRYPLHHSVKLLPISVTMGEVPTRKHSKWRNRTSDRKSDGLFWFGKPGFLFEFPSNRGSIWLSFREIHVWHMDGRTTSTIIITGPTLWRPI